MIKNFLKFVHEIKVKFRLDNIYTSALASYDILIDIVKIQKITLNCIQIFGVLTI